MVAPVPAKRFAFLRFECAEVNSAIRQQLPVFGFEVRADHGDDADRGEKTRRHRKIARRAAERFLDTAACGLDRVVSDRTNHHDTHKYFPTSGRRSSINRCGIALRSVMMVSLSACSHPQVRGRLPSARARPATAVCAFSTLSRITRRISPMSTAATLLCQQS